MPRPAPKPRTRKRPTKPPVTAAEREAAFRAELRRVANLPDTPADARHDLLMMAEGEYAEGVNRPLPLPEPGTTRQPRAPDVPGPGR